MLRVSKRLARIIVRPGSKTSLNKTFNKSEILEFCKLSGDYNPLHVEDDVVHGILLLSQFSNLASNNLPGPNTIIYKINETTFHHPLKVDTEIKVTLEISKIVKKFAFAKGTVVSEKSKKTFLTSELVLKMP